MDFEEIDEKLVLKKLHTANKNSNDTTIYYKKPYNLHKLFLTVANLDDSYIVDGVCADDNCLCFDFNFVDFISLSHKGLLVQYGEDIFPFKCHEIVDLSVE